MTASEAQTRHRQIEDLTLKEVDMIYSLSRVGECTELEIGKHYGISKDDVRKVFDNYEELRKTAKKNLPKEARNVGRNTRYGSNKERQAAYRARLEEKRRAEMQLPTPVTDAPAPVEEELPLPTIDPA
jgi:hypothetical protein